MWSKNYTELFELIRTGARFVAVIELDRKRQTAVIVSYFRDYGHSIGTHGVAYHTMYIEALDGCSELDFFIKECEKYKLKWTAMPPDN